MDFENLVQRYRDTLSSHILTIWQTKRARKNEENKENEEYRENEDLDLQAVDPEVEPLPWGWVCARVAEMLIHTPHGLTEPVILNQLLSEWQETSVTYRKGVLKRFSSLSTVSPRLNTKIRDYELIKYRRIRFNRASLSKTASSLTFLHTSNIITILTPSEEVLIDTLFTDSIADVLPTDIKNGRGYQFWTRVVFIGAKEPADMPGFCNKVCIYVRDMSSSQCATLVLLDDKIRMTTLFKTGDFLGIHWPYINIEDTYHDEIILHYGDLTVLFCLPMSELCKRGSKFKHFTKHKFNYQDNSYMIDYKFHYDRFFIKTLPLRGVNVTLYGKVDDILNNSSLILNNGKQIDRYTIKFSDKTGSQQITFWGKVGREIAEYHIGQYIVLEGLNTWKKSNGELEINGDASSGAMVYNVSMAKGWLAVSSLHSCSLSLATIINHQQIYQFICRCLITGWETNDDSFDINWRLDDGTGVIWAKAVGTVSQDILHSSGIETLTDSLIKTKLKKGHLGTNLIGKMLWCCISILASGKYQINAVLADYSDGSHSIAQADCARMLKEL
ncbi:nucleic acid-binding-like protein [Gigaspora margarita]|uniref:Nucleic acid-binding-like protein n=1 Tax=Gigaspora margarita TaxID=4874 RepID=A0A8H3X078_GIGMA|nr:nucleic acid-binding-like protein [Gigaspora margarita]